MHFRRQVFFGHTALVLVTLITGAISIVALRVATARLEHVAHSLASDMISVQRLRYRAERVVATSRGFLLAGDSQTQQRFDEAVRLVDETLAALDQKRGDLADEIAEVDDAAKAYIAAARHAVDQRSMTADPRDIIPYFERTLQPTREHFEATVDAFVAQEQTNFDRTSANARSLSSISQAIVTFTTGAAALLAIALAGLSIRKL